VEQEARPCAQHSTLGFHLLMIHNRVRNITGFLLILLTSLAGCGGGGGGGSTPPPTKYSISGTISGYSGSGLVLSNNTTTLAVNAGSTTFSFSGISNGSTYSITATTQPSNPTQTCTVINGSGTVNGADITNVQVYCVTKTYTISGSVTGLSGTGLVLQNNGADDLPVNSSNFTFNTPVANGNPYAVTILAQPTGQTCSVTNDSGTVGNANITNVLVSCTVIPPAPTNYTIGGIISGLSGNGLVLRNNGDDNLALNPNAAVSTFTFNTAIANGSPYNVTVFTQPAGQTCSVSNGNGMVSGANVTNVQVTCADIPTYTIGGTVSGLTGSGLVLQNNGGDNRTISGNGAFTFTTALTSGTSYNVSVLAQPSNQTCNVTGGSGTVASANITNVLVSCTEIPPAPTNYTISGSVSGLTGSGLVLQNNGGDNRAISANGAFTFNTAIASGSPYSVTVLAQPSGQTCSVANGSGTVTNAPITNVLVSCTLNSYSISGNVTGPLNGAPLPGTLILQNNGGDNISLNGYGIFTFPTSVASGLPYSVTVLQLPSSDWSCLPSRASGVVGVANVTDVLVNCVDNSTVPTGSMGTARRAHNANRLVDGRVLVAGGWNTNNATPLSSAEIFDQTANSGIGAYVATGSMSSARTSHTASTLDDGRVLIVGGWDNNGNLNSAEIFDPAQNANVGGFSATGSMSTVRSHHSAELLLDGTVLISGGYGGAGFPIASAEIFDPNSGSFSYTTGSMSWGRIFHTSTRLNDGTVLITGGQDSNGGLPYAEIYDPATKMFSTTGEMLSSRYKHTATLLSDGKVLIVGGSQNSDNPIASAEVYDPVTGTFHSTGSMAIPRADHTATLLKNGKVLITGGRHTSNDADALTTTEIYDPASGVFINGGSMGSARTDQTSTLLLDPSEKPHVLITGGFNGSSTVNSAELFVPH
jgi:hypothetical protein